MYLLAAPATLTILYLAAKRPTRSRSKELLRLWFFCLLLVALKFSYGYAYADEFDGDNWKKPLTERGLSDEERDKKFRTAQWCATKAMLKMNKAEEKIKELLPKYYDVKCACQSAIEGAIMSFAVSTSKEKLLVTTLTVVARYVDYGIKVVDEAYKHLEDARYFAARLDDLQYDLLTDKGFCFDLDNIDDCDFEDIEDWIGDEDLEDEFG